MSTKTKISKKNVKSATATPDLATCTILDLVRWCPGTRSSPELNELKRARRIAVWLLVHGHGMSSKAVARLADVSQTRVQQMLKLVEEPIEQRAYLLFRSRGRVRSGKTPTAQPSK